MDRPLIRIRLFFLFLLLAGCSNPSGWKYDEIVTGDATFDSTRLVYSPLSGYPPFKIELFKMNGEIEGFVYITQHRLNPQADDPGKILISLQLEERQVEESIPS